MNTSKASQQNSENLGSKSTGEPPIGLRPKYISDIDRAKEIRDAISRYINAPTPMAIPIEWVEEFNDLVESEMNRRIKKADGGNVFNMGKFKNSSMKWNHNPNEYFDLKSAIDSINEDLCKAIREEFGSPKSNALSPEELKELNQLLNKCKVEQSPELVPMDYIMELAINNPGATIVII